MEPPRRLIEKILDFCITVAICAFLLRLAMRWLVEAAPILLICVTAILGGILGYRIWKYLRDLGKW